LSTLFQARRSRRIEFLRESPATFWPRSCRDEMPDIIYRIHIQQLTKRCV
jgi:hypothetical protein